MATYKIVTDPPPRRAPEWLVRDPVPVSLPVEGQPPPATIIPYDQVAPGLYPDETVYELDSGERIALSVSTARKANGGGMDFRGWARVITKDGSTLLDAGGEEMELEFVHPVDAGTFDRLDEDNSPAEAKISREVILLMLGEPPTMMPVFVDLDLEQPEVAIDALDWQRHPEKAPPGTVLNPAASEAPLIGWPDEVRLNASIRHAIKLFGRAQPEVDVAALLADG